VAAAGVGIGLGVGMAAALQREPTIGMWLLPQYSTALFVRTTALVLLFGLVGSLYPALRAAMMTPVEALRYE
jgi:ABC-type antimicrobial peptide transport system permease subunit